ncbi:hypothetical protein WG622_12795, partial [Cognatishimia sp. D5M38]
QTGKDLSRTAANAQSLIEKALALCSAPRFLRQQHVVFPQNRRKADIRCRCKMLYSLAESGRCVPNL